MALLWNQCENGAKSWKEATLQLQNELVDEYATRGESGDVIDFKLKVYRAIIDLTQQCPTVVAKLVHREPKFDLFGLVEFLRAQQE